MSKLLQKTNSQQQRHHITPASAGWHYVGFDQYILAEGEQITCLQDGRELCIVVLTGYADIQTAEQTFSQVGGRMNLFGDTPPGAVYIPAGNLSARESTTVLATSAAEIAVCSAPGYGGSGAARLIDPASMPQEVRGEGTNTRYVRNILPETEPADSLLVVEVVTPSGHWSSYPPHKHDRDAAPQETLLEEIYYHRIQPSSGYVHQRVYTDDRSLDETLSAEDGDVVLVPKGYHPVGVPHGYTSYYLNVMAGPVREWHFYNDPAHEWMLEK